MKHRSLPKKEMSFVLQKLKLKDWLVYGGRTDLSFPDFELGRNLIVFNGSNGYGKTSLLQALFYVFRNGISKSELKEYYWNHQAKAAGEGSLEVEIVQGFAVRSTF